jgi:cysteine desulfurase
MLPYLTERLGNANSIHAWGIRARAAVEDARAHVAELIGAEDPSQIVFTSGATEGNNWLLKAFGSGWISPFEHSSVREPAEALAYGTLRNNGYDILAPSESRPESDGAGSHVPTTRLISVMTVNNEIGTVFDPTKLAVPGAALHSDATQAVGKVPFTVADLDFATLSAHKFYGPAGVGILYARDTASLSPLLLGGGHEGGLRSGTLNVAGIVGAGAAAKIASREWEADYAHASELRARILSVIADSPDFLVLGGSKVSPHILGLSFAGVEGESVVLELDALGFAVSSGAACSSRTVESSHVLRALALAEPWLRGTIRISFGRQNTRDAATALAVALTETVARLLKMRK